MNNSASVVRVLVTLIVVAAAIAVGWQLWSYYMLEPWTRDGRVRADVVTVAADVSGLVSKVFVHDNEKVTKGQPLFEIDQRRFLYALEQAKASAASRQVNLEQTKRDLTRAHPPTAAAAPVQQADQARQPSDVAKANPTNPTPSLDAASSISSVRL